MGSSILDGTLDSNEEDATVEVRTSDVSHLYTFAQFPVR